MEEVLPIYFWGSGVSQHFQHNYQDAWIHQASPGMLTAVLGN